LLLGRLRSGTASEVQATRGGATDARQVESITCRVETTACIRDGHLAGRVIGFLAHVGDLNATVEIGAIHSGAAITSQSEAVADRIDQAFFLNGIRSTTIEGQTVHGGAAIALKSEIFTSGVETTASSYRNNHACLVGWINALVGNFVAAIQKDTVDSRAAIASQSEGTACRIGRACLLDGTGSTAIEVHSVHSRAALTLQTKKVTVCVALARTGSSCVGHDDSNTGGEKVEE
jgi:hypothetical protein